MSEGAGLITDGAGRFPEETTVGSTLWTGVEKASGGACCFSGKGDIMSFSWRPIANIVSSSGGAGKGSDILGGVRAGRQED